MPKRYNYDKIRNFMIKNPQLNLKEVATYFNMPPSTLSRGLKYKEKDLKKLHEIYATRELRLKEERRLLTLERQIINKQVRENTFYNLIAENLKKELKKNKKKPQEIIIKEKENKKRQILFLGDFHYVDNKRSGYLENFSQNIIPHLDKEQKTYIILGGDYIENKHHTNQQLEYSSTIMRQTSEISNILSDELNKISSVINNEVIILGLVGNHDEIRYANIRSGDNKKENISDILKLFILRNKNDNITLKDFYFSYHLKKENMLIRHGHLLNIFNVNKIEDFILKERAQNIEKHKDINLYVFFHFHQFKHGIIKGTNIEYLVCPAMKNWINDFEIKYNLKSTYGAVLLKNDNSFKIIN